MITKQFTTVHQVVSWRLCMGCGACAAACQQQAISLMDILDQGIRPIVDGEKCQKCGRCPKV